MTLNELADVVRHIRARSGVKVIVDGGVGFGDTVHMSRNVQVLEDAGASAIILEDQVPPKRANHHSAIEYLIPYDEWSTK